MAKIVDWTELKEGDIFQVARCRSNLWARLIGYQSLDLYYQVVGGCIFECGTTVALAKLPQISRGQEVRVLDLAEVTGALYFRHLRDRKNDHTGSDPEIFVMRGKLRKKLFPAFQFLPTQAEQIKKHPGFFRSSGSGDATKAAFAYRDGFAAEATIQPATCHGYFIDYLREGMKRILTAAKEVDPTSELTVRNTFTISSATMSKASDEDVALGCAPSMNAYGDSPNLPTAARDFRMRFAGGHVHLGMRKKSPEVQSAIIKGCDLIAAIPAVAMFASIDTPIRRKYYGRAGEYRTPAHGLEYRVLSNAWLATPEVAHLMLNLVRAGVKVGVAGFNDRLGISEEEVREIINFCDVKKARAFVQKNQDVFTSLLTADGVAVSPNSDSGFRRIIEGGIEDLLPDFDKIESNWRLKPDSPRWGAHSNDSQATWGAFCQRLPTR